MSVEEWSVTWKGWFLNRGKRFSVNEVSWIKRPQWPLKLIVDPLFFSREAYNFPPSFFFIIFFYSFKLLSDKRLFFCRHIPIVWYSMSPYLVHSSTTTPFWFLKLWIVDETLVLWEGRPERGCLLSVMYF